MKRFTGSALWAAIATAVWAVWMFAFADAKFSIFSAAIYFAIMLGVFVLLSLWEGRREQKSD